jgi:hypothetical protein
MAWPEYTPSYWKDMLNSAKDYQDVDPIIARAAKKKTPFIQLLNKIGFKDSDTTKIDWAYEPTEKRSAVITSFDTDGDGTGINVDSTVGFFPGDLLQVLGTSRDTEQLRIDTNDSATDLTCTRDANGSTGVTLQIGDRLVLVGKQHEEGGNASREYHTPSELFNYIYLNSALVSRSLVRLRQKSRYDDLPWEDARVIAEFKKDYERNFWWGQAHKAAANDEWWSGDGIYEWVKWANTNDDEVQHIISIALSAFGPEAWRDACEKMDVHRESDEIYLFTGNTLYNEIYKMYDDKRLVTTQDFLEFSIRRIPSYIGDYNINLVRHPMFEHNIAGWAFKIDPAVIEGRNFIPWIQWPVDFRQQGRTQKGFMVYGSKAVKIKKPQTLSLIKLT